MTNIAVGSVWVSLDKSTPNRRVIVVGVDGEYVYARGVQVDVPAQKRGGPFPKGTVTGIDRRMTRIRRDRFFTGKISSGFSLMMTQPNMPTWVKQFLR